MVAINRFREVTISWWVSDVPGPRRRALLSGMSGPGGWLRGIARPSIGFAARLAVCAGAGSRLCSGEMDGPLSTL